MFNNIGLERIHNVSLCMCIILPAFWPSIHIRSSYLPTYQWGTTYEDPCPSMEIYTSQELQDMHHNKKDTTINIKKKKGWL